MTDERKPGDEELVEGAGDEGAAERDEAAVDETAEVETAEGETADRAKRWADEQTEHLHGATSSDATKARADEE
jgi:hypothetical protein